jgi:hypothetical protein
MSFCPKCGNENKCALEKGKQIHTCWCLYKDIPKKLSELYSPQEGCLCEKCIDEYKKEKE